jgi:hypothetical protein
MQRYRSETCTFAAYMHTIELIDKSRYLISQKHYIWKKKCRKYYKDESRRYFVPEIAI